MGEEGVEAASGEGGVAQAQARLPLVEEDSSSNPPGMEAQAAGEGVAAQLALAEKAHDRASAGRDDHEHKGKKALMVVDDKTAATHERVVGKGGNEKRRAAAEKKGKHGGDDDKPFVEEAEEEAGKEGGDDDKPFVEEAEEEAGKEGGDDDKPFVVEADAEEPSMEDDDASAGKVGDARNLLASAGKDSHKRKPFVSAVEESPKQDVDKNEKDSLMEGDADDSAGKENGKHDDEKAAPASEDEAANDDEDEEAANDDEDDEAANDDNGDEEAVNDDDEDDEAANDDEDAADPVQADAVAPHLPLDILVADVLSRLPSKEAGRCTVLSKGCEERLREKVFFNAHLLELHRRRNLNPASILVLKPTGRGTLPIGYSHLTLIDLATRVVFDMPVRTGTDLEDYHLWRNPNLPDPMVMDFFHNTVTELDLSLLACEGGLMLGHSGRHTGFFVCNPAEKRFVKLPAPPLDIDTSRAVAAIRGDKGEFSVVLLAVLPDPNSYAVHRFSSARDVPGHGWAVTQWENQEICSVVQGVSDPGVFGTETQSFYWISHTGIVLQYDPKQDRISLIPPPQPETEAFPIRKRWSLGSPAGRLRVSCFAVGPEAEEEPYLQIDMPGLLSVWTKNQAMWESVLNTSVPVVWMLSFFRLLELPIDAAGAVSDFILVKKDNNLLVRAIGLEGDGGAQFLSNLYLNEDPFLHRMYESFKAFFIYL